MKFLGYLLKVCLVLALIGILFWFAWLSWPTAEHPQVPKQPYLDMHVHVAGLGFGDSGIFISDELRENFRFPFYLHAFGVTEEELETNGDAYLLEIISQQLKDSTFIDRAVILALDGVIDAEGQLDKANTTVYVPNEFLIRELGQYENLYFGASINPYRADSLERLNKVVNEGAVLIKWIPNIMHIDPADTAIEPFYEQMKELGVPLLTHTGRERAFGHADDLLSDPQRLRLPLKIGVTVIAAHIATTGETDGEEHFDRIQPLFEEFPNLHADISSLTQYNKLNYLHRMLERGKYIDRLLYGTDWPLQFFPVVSPFYHLSIIRIEDAKLVSSIANTWDRDVVLKKKMGVPEIVFTNSARLLLKPVEEESTQEGEEQREQNPE